MIVDRILDEAQNEHLTALTILFICMGQWDTEKPGLSSINDLAVTRSLLSDTEAESFTRCFVILMRDEWDFVSLLLQRSRMWLLEVCSGANVDIDNSLWRGTSEDIETLSRMSVVTLGLDLITRTCELLSSSQGWPAAPNRRYKGSQCHIEYFEKNPLDTVALFSMAWHGNLSPVAKELCERFIAFAEAQDLTQQLAIIRGTEYLLDHRIYYMRLFFRVFGDPNVAREQQYGERPLEDVERILKEVELLCQSAVYREYMEELSKSKGDKAGEKWKVYWEFQVDTAIAEKEGTIWKLLENSGYPAKASAVIEVKGIGAHLWSRLSQPIHHPNLRAAKDYFTTPLDYWRKEEREVLLVIKKLAHEQAPDEMPAWAKSTNWRS